ncbi:MULTISPECIES: DsbA family protein [Paracoccus]|uniref:DsbA family protein n=1 Tax=Paracoccus TaxID=265 RepID=UPI000FD84C90|nr:MULTISPECIES: DsbA family protein [Paracoccus]AZY92302.1 DsbA family protein [Paracoccus sp. Arc7-R13]MCO6362115.1 thioredoxin domain-containing protein [Paracoccus sp. 08]TNC03691.1 DsbA family protein [Paracoccus marcusii]TYP68189.1 DSBA-like thioredoxin domain-containing protein [Stutzerimonas stutzeri]
MPTRRFLLASAGAFAAMPAFAQDRPNPMPDELRQALERDPTAPVLGNPDGNITLTEFFDYNCPHCKTMLPLMSELVRSDPQLRVVLREWPVFGPGSEFAARASLATLPTGNYWRLHAALLGMRARAEEATVMRVVRDLGLDEAAIRTGMQADTVERHITYSHLLGDHMGLMGTPSFICGDEAAFGAMTLEELRALVQRGRRTMGV